MTRTVHLAVYDTLADWEVGHTTAHINSGAWQRNPDRFRIATVGETLDPVTTMGGLTLTPDIALADLDPTDSAMLILPGADTWLSGGNGAFVEAARRFLAAGVPVAAICGATGGLAAGGLLDDRRHTSNAREVLEATGYGGGPLYATGPRSPTATSSRPAARPRSTSPAARSARARPLRARRGGLEQAVRRRRPGRLLRADGGVVVTTEQELLRRPALTVFRLNGQFLGLAEELTRPVGLTAARWQVLGAVLSTPLTVAGVGRAIGITRQSVQRTADLLVGEGLAEYVDNPAHRRAKLFRPTAAGYEAVRRIGPCTRWRRAGWRARSATTSWPTRSRRSSSCPPRSRPWLRTTSRDGTGAAAVPGRRRPVRARRPRRPPRSGPLRARPAGCARSGSRSSECGGWPITGATYDWRRWEVELNRYPQYLTASTGSTSTTSTCARRRRAPAADAHPRLADVRGRVARPDRAVDRGGTGVRPGHPVDPRVRILGRPASPAGTGPASPRPSPS